MKIVLLTLNLKNGYCIIDLLNSPKYHILKINYTKHFGDFTVAENLKSHEGMKLT